MEGDQLPEIMNMLRQLKMQVQRQLTRDLDKANQYFNTTFTPPTIHYNVRGVKAGVAYLAQNEIRLNPVLLQENGAEFVRQVVPHELAHLVVYQQFGRVPPHGKEWKMVMERVFGAPADIYHCFDTANVVGKQFSYRCHCQTHQLSVRRHHAIMQNKCAYLCKKCKTPLIFQNT